MTDISSRGLVKQALAFGAPYRVPRDLWVLPWASDHYPSELKAIQTQFPSDFTGAPGFYKKLPVTTGDPYGIGTYVDEWGCIFENRQKGVIGEVKQPLVEKWDDLDKVRPPEELLSIDKEQVNAFCRSTDHFVFGGSCPRPFERLQFIRSSEALYYDLGSQSAEVIVLLNRLHQYYLKELKAWAETDVDALNFMDDWGAQGALLISPAMWRRIFKPLYKEYIDLAHSHGKYIFMHSDGYIADIIPDLVEMGLDALNSQLFCMDIEDIGRRFKGKITFWGELDRQHILPEGSLADVDRAVRRVKEALFQDGGVIAQCEFSAGSRPENVYQMFKTWDELFPGAA
jgi:uroporphyrinogen decarboxylase